MQSQDNNRRRRPRTGARFPAVAAALTPILAVSAAQADTFEGGLAPVRVESTTIDDRFTDRRTDPSTASVIRGEDLEGANATNLEQVLRQVPGLTPDVWTGDTLKIKMRGIENQRYMGEDPGVAVIIDGVPVKEDIGRVNIDLDNIESIRVTRGSASYLYGEDALAGAVVITTKRGADMAGFRTEAAAGSHGFRRGLLGAGHAADSFNTYIQASRREADGWHARSDYKAEYLNGKFQYYVDDFSDVTFNFEHGDRYRDEHGTVRGLTQAKEDPRNKGEVRGSFSRNFHVDLARYSATYSRDIGNTGNVMLSTYRFTDETWFWASPMRFDADGNAVNDHDLYSQLRDKEQTQRGIKSEWRAGGDRLAGLAGVDLRANTYDETVEVLNDHRTNPSPASLRTAGTVLGDHTTDETVHAVYGEVKARVAPRWVATLNARHDRINLDHTDYLDERELDRDFNVWSWRTGVVFNATPSADLFAAVSTGFRTPTVGQLFSGAGLDEADGNPDLDPERAVNLELGARTHTWWRGRPVAAEATLFRTERKDFILSSAGQYATSTDEAEARYENIGGARHQGLELSAWAKPTEIVSLRGAYTYLDARFTQYDNFNLALGNSRGDYLGECDDVTLTNPAGEFCTERYDNEGNRIPRASKHTLNLGVDIEPTPRLTVGAESHTVSSWYGDELNTLKVDGHTLFNLVANYQLEPGLGEWRLFGRIDNLTDRTYYTAVYAHSDTNYDGVFDWEDASIIVNPGRTWTAGVAGRF